MLDRGRFTVRTFEPGDEPALLELHRSAFAGHPPRTAGQWRWRYVENPLGATQIVVACEANGALAAVYGGIPHRIVLRGEESRAVLQSDVAVAPRYQGTPTASVLVAATGRRHFELYAGGATRLTWGFPEPGLQRIGLRHLEFEVLRDVLFLAREVGAPRWPPPASIAVERVARLGPAADELWARCRGEIDAGTIRDARYLDWRYAEESGLEHVRLVARDAGGAARGIAVLRGGGWTDEIVSVLDWLVPLDDRDAEAALVARALEETAARGKSHLLAWCAGAPALFLRFQRDHGFFVQPTPYQECFRTWLAAARRRWLAQHWYQTMGDLDFF